MDVELLLQLKVVRQRHGLLAVKTEAVTHVGGTQGMARTSSRDDWLSDTATKRAPPLEIGLLFKKTPSTYSHRRLPQSRFGS